jgi:hypothetical protein
MYYLLTITLVKQIMLQKYRNRLPRDAKRRQLIKEAIAGCGRMNQFTEEELWRNLPKMTEDEARQVFEELYAAWEHTRKYYPSHPKGDAILDKIHIEELVETRLSF